jgi:predicted class III extradiol MEMO1 family dioxygenase
MPCISFFSSFPQFNYPVAARVFAMHISTGNTVKLLLLCKTLGPTFHIRNESNWHTSLGSLEVQSHLVATACKLGRLATQLDALSPGRPVTRT